MANPRRRYGGSDNLTNRDNWYPNNSSSNSSRFNHDNYGSNKNDKNEPDEHLRSFNRPNHWFEKNDQETNKIYNGFIYDVNDRNTGKPVDETSSMINKMPNASNRELIRAIPTKRVNPNYEEHSVKRMKNDYCPRNTTDSSKTLQVNEHQGFSCPHCNVTFYTWNEYNLHINQNNHLNKMRRVEISIGNKFQMIRHEIIAEESKMNVNSRNMYYDCSQCEIFSKNLKDHLGGLLHAKMKRFLYPVCKICSMRFKSPLLYEYHLCCYSHLKKVYDYNTKKTPIDPISNADKTDKDLNNIHNIEILGFTTKNKKDSTSKNCNGLGYHDEHTRPDISRPDYKTKKSENDLLDSKNKPVFKPVCPHCKVACNTSDDYLLHLNQNNHDKEMCYLEKNIERKLRMIRQEISEEERIITNEKHKFVQKKTCFQCNILTKNLTGHLVGFLHLKMKQYLRPFCQLCSLELKSPILYEHHLCSIFHLKKEYDYNTLKTPDAPVSSADKTDKDVDKIYDSETLDKEISKTHKETICYLCELNLMPYNGDKKRAYQHKPSCIQKYEQKTGKAVDKDDRIEYFNIYRNIIYKNVDNDKKDTDLQSSYNSLSVNVEHEIIQMDDDTLWAQIDHVISDDN